MRRSVLATGLAMVAVGLVGTVVLLLQPWRRCDDDDSPAACAMLPGDATALMLFLGLLAIGAAVAAGSAALSGRDREAAAEQP